MKSFCLYLTFLVLATQQLETSACTKEIRAFVDGHNSRRLQVAQGKISGQPSASEMKIVMWDQELYAKAKAWAANNRFQHNPDRSVPSGRFSTGENIFSISTTNSNFKVDPDVAVASWFSEHANYTYGPIRSEDFDGSKKYQIGHYTQVVWADSIYIGCAISQSQDGKWYKSLVVCNYAPTGNWLGSVPYKKGGPSEKLTCGCNKNDKTCDCNKLYGGNC